MSKKATYTRTLFRLHSWLGGYFGEVDHLIPWQIDHLIVWRPVAEKSCRSSFKIS